MKLDFDANTVEGATGYLEARAEQFLKFGFSLKEIKEVETGVVSALFEKGSKFYQSVYILNDYRGRGLYKKSLAGHTILTAVDCNMEEYLTKHNIDFVVVDPYNQEEK